jgi:hypothetical protein
VIFSAVYLLVRCLLSCLVVLARSEVIVGPTDACDGTCGGGAGSS